MKRKAEFSKVVFWLLFVLTVGVTVAAFALMWYTGDAQGLVYLIPAVYGALGTATGFYYWKAKKENMIKLMKAEGLKIEKSDIQDRDTFEASYDAERNVYEEQ